MNCFKRTRLAIGCLVLATLLNLAFATESTSAAPLLNSVQGAPTPATGYKLPYPNGHTHVVTQGWHGSTSHNYAETEFAVDFDMDGEVVVAAKSGWVQAASLESKVGGCSSAYSNDANYIVLRHGDGTQTLYLHLRYHSQLTDLGIDRWVEQGQPLALSGATGYTCNAQGNGPGPHLHFQVQYQSSGGRHGRSIPFSMDDVPGGEPKQGRYYTSGNVPPQSYPTYMLKASHSGKCLDVGGGSALNGAEVVQWDCHGGTNQQFQFVTVNGNPSLVYIKPKHSGKCLEVGGGAMENGARINQWDCVDAPWQQWKVDWFGGITLTAAHSGKVMDVSNISYDNGAKIHQWDFVRGRNQVWFRIKV